MLFVRVLIVSSILTTPIFAHASCADLLRRVRRAAVMLTGRQLMQEGLPLKDQLIGKDYPQDWELAYAWLDREGRQNAALSRAYGRTTDYWGPIPSMIQFLPTIPNWKMLKNDELRKWCAMKTLVDFDISEDMELAAVIVKENDLSLSDLEKWDLAFPDRVIPERVWSFARN